MADLDKNEKFTVADLDGGRIVEELNAAIKMAALDVKNRPGNTKPRKINWTISLAPTDGGFVTVQAEIPKLTLPKDKAISTICGMPDESGNLKNLQTANTQYGLPINFSVEE